MGIHRVKLYLTLITALLISCITASCAGRQDSGTVTDDKKIRAAVIDTGFSEKAIPSGNIAGGKNYVDGDMGTDDTYGHGTAVASIILGNAPDTELVALVSSVYEHGRLKQVDADTFAGIIIDAVDVYGCDVINVSSGFAVDTEALRQAVEYVEKKGVVIVASAGNDYVENPDVKYYPAAYDGVIAVGSINESRTAISEFSQRGEWVDVYECGENITVRTLSGDSREVSGTSYAAAGVTSKVCRILEENSGLTVDKVLEIIDFKGN